MRKVNLIFIQACRRLFIIALCFQISFGPVAIAYDDDNHESDNDGPSVLCIGRCDDESSDENAGNTYGEAGGSNGDYDDDGTDDSEDFDSRDAGGGDQSDRGHGDDREDLARENQERTDGRRKLSQGDKDRGDGVIFVRDDKGKVYYRGSPSELVKDEQGDYYSGDHTDIYFDAKDQKFVKSTDGQSLLNLNNLLLCAPSFDCEFEGFREDWWNYSMGPELDNGDEANEWYDLEQFSKRHFQIKKGIDKAWDDPSISRSPDKAAVLQTAEFLYDEAKNAFENRLSGEAIALQEGAAHLTSTLVDIGLGISPLGWAKDAYELISGKSLVTGQALTPNERLLSGIGVMMPGVAGFAFAGMKIISRHPLSRKGITTAAAQAENLSNFLGDLKPVRFKEGKNTTEVAIIGRDMTYVKEAGNRLNAAGIKTRIFQSSKKAEKDLENKVARNNGNLISYDKIPDTLTYKENMNWIDKVNYDQIPVLDIGNPSKKANSSRFYDDEILRTFGKSK